MRRTNILLNAGKIIVLIALFLATAFIAGCGSLRAPAKIELNDRILTWDEVKGAVGYVVIINDVEHIATENEFLLPEDLFGPITVSVKAFDRKNNSATSAAFDFTAILRLPAPENVRQEGNKIVWDAVPGANGYVIKINGVEYVCLENEYSLAGQTASEVSVLAVGRSDGLVVSSEYSETLLIKEALGSPKNIKENNGIVSWDEVENADRYLIIINGEIEKVSEIPTISLRYQFAGSVNIKIRAESEGYYIASEYSEVNLEIAKLTMPAPENVALKDGELFFDPVEHASGYEIYAGGELLATVTTTNYQVPAEILNLDGCYLQVRTLSEVSDPSELSLPIFCKVTEITTEEELRAISSHGSYVLGADIALSAPWQPPAVFSGVFDGNGHTISGVAIGADREEVGFFALLSGAIVRNVTLKGSIEVQCRKPSARVGGLAGRITSSEITGVTVEIDIEAVSENGVGHAGGIAGIIEKSNMTSVAYSGKITTEHFVTGGFAGTSRDPESEIVVKKSAVIAEIVVVGGLQSISGGFIAMMADNSLHIKESYAQIDLSGPGYVGGFVGYLGSGKITDCYAEGTVRAAGALVHTGGFIGRLEGYNSLVVNSIAFVDVSGEGDEVLAGGFVGRTLGGTYATVFQNCFYNKTIAPIDRIGNPESGRGDGIAAYYTEELTELLPGLSPDIWKFVSGNNPRLKCHS